MNFLRRRLSDSSFVANLPNGYMMDLQRPDNSTSSPVSPALERKQQPPQQNPASSSSSSGSSLFSSITNAVKQTTQAAAGLVEPTGPPAPPVVLKPKILLVIDDAHTDWPKYFRGKKVNMEYEIRVEQAEFSELNLASYVNGGCMVDMQVMRNGTKVVRSFKPDFVLIRQHAYSMTPGEDFRSLILGLQYGGVPSVNSLYSIHNFCSKPWVFSQLIKIFQSLGAEKFPLIEQSFFPNHKQMVSDTGFPYGSRTRRRDVSGAVCYGLVSGCGQYSISDPSNNPLCLLSGTVTASGPYVNSYGERCGDDLSRRDRAKIKPRAVLETSGAEIHEGRRQLESFVHILAFWGVLTTRGSSARYHNDLLTVIVPLSDPLTVIVPLSDLLTVIVLLSVPLTVIVLLSVPLTVIVPLSVPLTVIVPLSDPLTVIVPLSDLLTVIVLLSVPLTVIVLLSVPLTVIVPLTSCADPPASPRRPAAPGGRSAHRF
ncbi:Synapsin N-terminal [Pristimantis euphronides]